MAQEAVLPSGKDALLEAVEAMREGIVDLLCHLVRIPSVSPEQPGLSAEGNEWLGGETRCNEVLRDLAASLGLEADLWETKPGRANLAAVWRGGGGRSLILNGHIDTVMPVTPREAWKGSTPFSGLVEGGRVWGLGAADMKSGLVAQFKAVEALQKAGVRLAGDLILLSVVGEEMMQHELGTSAAVKRGYRADGAIVSEPTGPPALAVAPATMGNFWLRLVVRGRATHCGARGLTLRPGGGGSEVGVSAIEKALFLHSAILRLEEQWAFSKAHPLYPPGHFTFNLGHLRGESAGLPFPNTVPERCLLDYVVWYPPQEEPEAIKAEVAHFIEKACQLDPWLRENPPELEWVGNWPAFETPVNHPLVQAMAHAHERTASGHAEYDRARFTGFSAVCDGSFLSIVGIPSVVYGPGSIAQAHSLNEWVSIEQVVTATKALALCAMDWCGVAS